MQGIKFLVVLLFALLLGQLHSWYYQLVGHSGMVRYNRSPTLQISASALRGSLNIWGAIIVMNECRSVMITKLLQCLLPPPSALREQPPLSDFFLDLNFWNRGIWQSFFLVVNENQVLPVIWGWGWYFGDINWCSATPFHLSRNGHLLCLLTMRTNNAFVKEARCVVSIKILLLLASPPRRESTPSNTHPK